MPNRLANVFPSMAPYPQSFVPTGMLVGCKLLTPRDKYLVCASPNSNVGCNSHDSAFMKKSMCSTDRFGDVLPRSFCILLDYNSIKLIIHGRWRAVDVLDFTMEQTYAGLFQTSALKRLGLSAP